MRQLSDRLVRCSLILFFIIQFFSIALTPTLAVASPTSILSPAVSNLQSCIATQHRVEIAAMVDTSGSLQQSDPTNARVPALQQVIAQLDAIATTENVMVDFTMIGFSDKSSIVQPWTKLNDSSAQNLINRANVFRKMNNGPTTNFPDAINSTVAQLQLNAGSQPSICRAILWFTDGAIDVGGSSTRASSVAQMCAKGGYADELASNGIFTFAVGLTTPGGMDSQATSELKSYVEGSPNSFGSCGTKVSQQTGALFSVSNPALLLFALGSALNPALTSSPAVLEECAAQINCSSLNPFWIGSGVGSFSVVSNSGNPIGVPRIILQSPSGKHVLLDIGSQVVDGVNIFLKSYSPGSINLSAKIINISAATGQWAIAFLPPIRSTPTKIYYALVLQPSVGLKIIGNPVFVRNSSLLTGYVGVVNLANGQSVSGLRMTNVSLQLNGSDVLTNDGQVTIDLQPSTNNRYAYSFVNTLPFNGLSATMKGDVLVGPNGESVPVLSVQSVSAPLSPGYPSVSLVNSKMSALLPTKKSVASIRITANEVPGCFYLGSVKSTTSNSLKITQKISKVPYRADKCTSIQPGNSKTFTISTSMVHPVGGFISENVIVEVQGRQTDQFEPVSLQYSITAVKPINVGRSISVLLALLLIGIILLFLVGRFINRFMGKFQPSPQDLRMKTYHVAISVDSEGFITSLSNHQEPELRSPSLSELAGEGTSRTVQAFEKDGLRFSTGPRKGLGGAFRSLIEGNVGFITETSGAPLIFGGLSTPTSELVTSGTREIPGLGISTLWVFRPKNSLGIVGSNVLSEESSSKAVEGDLTLLLENGNSSNMMRPLLAHAFTALRGNIEQLLSAQSSQVISNHEETLITEYTNHQAIDDPEF